MNKHFMTTAFVLLAGVAIGALARDAINDATVPIASIPPATTPEEFVMLASDDPGELADAVRRLQATLQDERAGREELEDQLVDLEARVDALQRELEASRGQPGTRQGREERMKALGQPGALTVERLMAAGLSEQDAALIKNRLDEIALERLFLRDQASREGWMGTPRWREEISRINNAQQGVRQEFGDSAYDRYLYASGRPNRIKVSSVMNNSPAYNAGLQSGDSVVSYDGQRVFAPNELRNSTRGGSAGQTVAITVMRDGQQVTLYVPRGPLGVQMTSDSEKP